MDIKIFEVMKFLILNNWSLFFYAIKKLVTKKQESMSYNEIIILLFVGLAGGILSGIMGVGGGIIIVPALVYFLGFSQHTAQGTSLAMMLPPVGVLAVMNYYKEGYVDMKAAIFLVIAFIVGGYFGSLISVHVSPKTLKRIFAVLLMASAVKLFIGK